MFSILNRQLILAIFILFSAFNALADEIQFEARAPRVVQVGERFQLVYVVNNKTENPTVDIPEAFRIIYGPSVSQSSRMEIINGQVSQSFTLTFTYLLMAEKEGTFTIPAAKVNHKGKTYQSNPVLVEVVKGEASTAQQGNQRQPQQSQGRRQSAASVTDGDFFVRIHVDKTSVYQGEAIVATLKLYTTLELNNFEKLEMPKFVGFFKEEIETASQIQLQRENVNGRIYQTGVLARYLLFPQRTGIIEIDPLTVDVIVTERLRTNDPFEAFFGGNVRRYKVGSSSPVVKIEVKPLPEPKPVDFTGGVGQIRLEATVSRDQLNVNDALNFRVRFVGTGNIKFLDNPTISFPKEFEVYDPKKDVNVRITQNGASGVVLWDYLVIPRVHGKFTIPAISVSYFDLESKSYKKLTAGPFQITAEGTASQGTAAQRQTGVYRQNIQDIGTDIRFIQIGNLNLKPSRNYLFGTTRFWAMYLLPLLAFLIYFVIRRKQMIENSDIVRVRNKRAAKVSKTRLKSARKYIKDNKDAEVYDEVLRALWQYLADKLIIDQSKLTRDEILNQMKVRNVDADLIKRVIELADTCEMARYAPTLSKTPAAEVYQQAVELLVQLEKAIK